MNEQSITDHLSGQLIESDGADFLSCFTAALRDARGITGRDLETVQKTDRSRLGSWLGAVCYLILIDQIGSCFRPKNRANHTEKNAFKTALALFTHLNPKDRNALWALRCSLAHDYSLVNFNPNAGKGTHHFKLLYDSSAPLITHPATDWDGMYPFMNEENLTVINLEALGDLVEDIVATLRRLASLRELEVCLPYGEKELGYRYAFQHRRKI